jgi:CDP-glycerol glycerophosphotransferase (TagB/SpsB family)
MSARRFFSGNDVVEVCGEGVSYRELLSAGSLLVTDYSSTAFDFAYMRKPVVYAHFDAERFFSGGHTYGKGYFDYRRDGFGEVETTLDALVGRIVGYLEAGCELNPGYRQRIDGFFAFSGGENCRRVFDRIVELTGRWES